MNKYLSTTAWFCFVSISIGMASYGLITGWQPGLVLLIQGTAAYAVCIAAELLVPFRGDWRWWGDHNVVSDIGHVLVFDQSLQNLYAIATIMIFTYVYPSPAGMPVATPLMIIAGVVYLEVSEYWRHRLLHASDRFWPIHALHHHLDRMHIFRSGRVHFMDGIARVTLTFIPALLIGLPTEAIMWWMILLNATGPISHSNLNIVTPSFINSIIATPAVHRIHHASEHGFMFHNLAPVCPLVDRLFNTWLDPDGNPVKNVGIEPDFMPTSFVQQLIYPFVHMAPNWLVRRWLKLN